MVAAYIWEMKVTICNCTDIVVLVLFPCYFSTRFRLWAGNGNKSTLMRVEY